MLGILAGRGDLPRLLIDHCRESGRPHFVLAFEGETPPETVAGTPHAWVRLGQVGKALLHLKKAAVSKVMLAGGIRKPSLANLGLDFTGVRLMARIGTGAYSGDNAVLSAIVGFLEEQGLRVVGVEQALPELLAEEGLLGGPEMSEHAHADILVGVQAARELGRLDRGQAVIVRGGEVLGEEDADGTDTLIERCAALSGSGGVLVKAAKPGQERRADLPAIGVQTLERLADGGFDGVAVEAGAALILGRDAVREAAERLGVFVYGIAIDSES